MNQQKKDVKQTIFRHTIIVFIILCASMLYSAGITAVSHASSSQVGTSQVTLNPGGGILANGSDGLRFTINSDAGGSGYDSAIAGQDGVVYRATRQYCCGAGAPHLNIGGTLYGQAGPAYSSATWNSIDIISTSGATSIGARTSTTGNSSATVRYTVIKGGLTYTIDRTVTYTYPNDYVTDSYTFSIPEGNTETVKFYLGGDTAPGSSDQGYGIMLTSPVRSVISLNTSSQIMFGFREVSGSKIFDGATSQSFSAPYVTVQTGGNIGYVVTASNHDAGLMMQWNLGSTPGTQTASLQQFATQQGTNLNASLSSELTTPNSPVQLNISIANTVLSAVNNIGYTMSLPSGLVIGSGSQSNSCGGTFTATAGVSSIVLSDGSVGSGSNCVMSVPVQSATNGTYTISSANISGLSNATNNVGSSSLVVTNDNDNDSITNDTENNAPNTGDGNNDSTNDASQDHVTSLVNAVTGEYTTLTVDASCDLTNTSIKQSSQLGSDDYTYPFGLVDFTADCGTPGFTTTVTQYYFNPSAQDFILRKFINGSYRTVSGATFNTQTIGGTSALVVSYQITDGGELDDDGTVNGVIVDPAGPAILASTTTIPSTVTTQASAPDTGYGAPQKMPLATLVAMLLIPTTFLTGIYAARHLYLARR